jgi:formylglycine-generating enzyme required for sulfatase activity
MAAAIWIAATLVAVGLTIPVAKHRGGLAAFLGLREATPSVDAPAPATAAPDGEPSKAAPVPAIPPGECPPDSVRIAATDGELTCIDAGEYPGLREIPRVSVTLAEARTLCTERGRRLCRAAEWRRACEGPAREAYPYGASHVAEMCNEARQDGTGANLSRSGARDRCVSADGAYDLVGNVGEWVDDGTVHGGDANTSQPTCTSSVQARASDKSPSTGFRCCVTVPRR